MMTPVLFVDICIYWIRDKVYRLYFIIKKMYRSIHFFYLHNTTWEKRIGEKTIAFVQCQTRNCLCVTILKDTIYFDYQSLFVFAITKRSLSIIISSKYQINNHRREREFNLISYLWSHYARRRWDSLSWVLSSRTWLLLCLCLCSVK